MPMYTFACPDCHAEITEFYHMEPGPPLRKRCECGKMKRRVFRAPQVHVFEAYVTTDVTGSPIHIASKAEENDVCRRHGVRRTGPCDDVKNWHKPNVVDTFNKTALPMKDDVLRTAQEMGVRLPV